MSRLAIDRVCEFTRPAEVAAAFSLPAAERPEDRWWEWPNVVSGFHLAVQERLQEPTAFPEPALPRGIVIVGGGQYLPSVYVTVRVLRHVGCTLPIDVWHFDGEDEPRQVDAIGQYDVSFVNAGQVARHSPFRFLNWHWWRGWQLKSFALRHTRFQQVLYLDADCYPVRDPEYLFDWQEFQRQGAVFWPDLETSPTKVSDSVLSLFQIARPDDRLTESGQMLLDRQRVWQPLSLAAFYNECADLIYRYVWGDKDTFPFAWLRSGETYARMWPECDYRSDCLLQYDNLGRVIFQHRVSDKFKLNGSRFASTCQRQHENRYHGDLAHESFCFHALDQLRKIVSATTPMTLLSDWAADLDSTSPAKEKVPNCAPVGDEPQSIEAMYPPVSVEMLCSELWQQRFREEFLDSGEFQADPFECTPLAHRPQSRCVAVSLFKQNVDNHYRDQLPVNHDNWRRKYWDGLANLVREMPQLPDWKLRVYVERDLIADALREFSAHPQVELYGMHVNSVGASPGALWRLLGLGDSTLELTLVTDIDEPLSPKLDFVNSFILDTSSALGRVGDFVSDHQYLVDPRAGVVKNYPTIIGSRVIARPRLCSFDLAAAMRGFMAFRKQRARSATPWSYADGERPSPYNRPIGRHIYGWGSHWSMYCFDERFLKHVLYYHFADKGELHTWALPLPPDQRSPEVDRDRRYLRQRACPTVAPGRATRLKPLDLPASVIRTAFSIDEYHWVFARLLELMREHSRTGFCGNLFFDDIGQPDCLEHVPKQIRLFEAARTASRVLEIGFNAGHSSALMLAANPDLRIRAFDLCLHDYTLPCLMFLNQVFRDRIHLVRGASQVTVPLDSQQGYDLLHIDGDHTYACVRDDLAHCLPKASDGALVVMDDYAVGNDVERAVREREDLTTVSTHWRQTSVLTSAQGIFRYRRGVAGSPTTPIAIGRFVAGSPRTPAADG